MADKTDPQYWLDLARNAEAAGDQAAVDTFVAKAREVFAQPSWELNDQQKGLGFNSEETGACFCIWEISTAVKTGRVGMEGLGLGVGARLSSLLVS